MLSAAVPTVSTGRYLYYNVTACKCDGMGQVYNYLRASAHYVTQFNLSYVHFPVCARYTDGTKHSQEIAASSVDSWLQLDAGQPCSSACIVIAVINLPFGTYRAP